MWKFFFLFSLLYAGDIERIAIVLGNNAGLSKERPLQYAQKDAEEFAKVLKTGGVFDTDRIYLLVNNTVDQVRDVFSEVRGRMREINRQKKKAMLLFFYSGHGAQGDLHLNKAVWKKQEIIDQLASIQADLKISIVDACESGSLLQKKGKIENATLMKIEEALDSKGSVFISSSGAGEWSHESEKYKGAIFTHHLIQALKGVADFNNDHQVGVLEMYQYAKNATHLDEQFDENVKQTPHFNIQLEGEKDVALVNHSNLVGSNVVLNGFFGKTLEIYNARSSELVSRFHVHTNFPVNYQMETGQYIFRYLENEKTYVFSLNSTFGQSENVAISDFNRVQKNKYSFKGGVPFIRKMGSYFGGHSVKVGNEHFLLSSLTGLYQFDQIQYRLSILLSQSRQDFQSIVEEETPLLVNASVLKSLWNPQYGDLYFGASLFGGVVFQKYRDNRKSVLGFNDETETLHSRDSFYALGFSTSWEQFLPWNFSMLLDVTPSVHFYQDHFGFGVNSGLHLGLNF